MIIFNHDSRVHDSHKPGLVRATVPSSLEFYLKERAKLFGTPNAVQAGQFLAYGFAEAVRQQMLAIQIDPRTLSNTELEAACQGHYQTVLLGQLSLMTGLTAAFLEHLYAAGLIPCRRYHYPFFFSGWFDREDIVAWVSSDECRQLYDANPHHHIHEI